MSDGRPCDALSDKSVAVMLDVLDERARQDAKWGEQNHAPEVWLAILGEEYGELSTAILRERFGTGDYEHRAVEDIRSEAIQVAAVAVAFVEFLDRRGVSAGGSPAGGL